MIKYAVITASFEFDPHKYTASEAFFDYGMQWAETVKICDSLEEARVELKKIPVRTHVYNWKLALAEVSAIEEAEFDLDEDSGEWEFISGSNFWDFTSEEIEKN